MPVSKSSHSLYVFPAHAEDEPPAPVVPEAPDDPRCRRRRRAAAARRRARPARPRRPAGPRCPGPCRRVRPCLPSRRRRSAPPPCRRRRSGRRDRAAGAPPRPARADGAAAPAVPPVIEPASPPVPTVPAAPLPPCPVVGGVSLLAQPTRRPPARRRRSCRDHSITPATGAAGVGRSVVVPSPSCPESFEPQHDDRAVRRRRAGVKSAARDRGRQRQPRDGDRRRAVGRRPVAELAGGVPAPAPDARRSRGWRSCGCSRSRSRPRRRQPDDRDGHRAVGRRPVAELAVARSSPQQATCRPRAARRCG